MLKRFQVLLTDWQEEYLRYICKKHDYSFSEIIRLILSQGILNMILNISPEYKPEINKRELHRMTKSVTRMNNTQAERYKYISIILYEAQKAIDYRLQKVGKKKPKKK